MATNGLGSFASGTVSDARTHYHGWLIAALDRPVVVRSCFHLDASLEVAGLVVALGTNFWGGEVEPTGFKLLRSLRLSRFRLGFGENWQLSRQLVMPYGLGERERYNI